MSKLKSLISILTLVGLIMTSCGKETIYIEKEPDGNGYENLDPAVRALIDDLRNRTWPYYVENVRYDDHSRIVPANGTTINITISGTEGPWVIRAVEIYPTEGGSEIELADAVSNNFKTDITFPANPKNDVIVWELQIRPHDGTEWSYFGFYVQLCNNEMAYEIQDVEHNIVNADTESINIRLTKQNVMESEDDLIWLTVYEEGSSVALASAPYNLAMMSAGAYTELKINANENPNDIRTLYIDYRLDNSAVSHRLGIVIQRPGTEIPLTVVSGLKIGDGGHHQIEAVRVNRTLQLEVGFCPEDEINVRVKPYQHTAYNENSFTPMDFTVRRSDDWKFDVEFPAARGLQYGIGEEAGGWHANFKNDLKAGIHGAGCWAVSYENEQGEWIPFGQVIQRAYYFGVSNKTSSISKNGGNWVVKTQGYWPENTVRIRAARKITAGEMLPLDDVIVNTTSTTLDAWEFGPAIIIPENSTIDSIYQWKFQYWIDEIGEWKTWEQRNNLTTPECGWEGTSNQLVQPYY